MLRVGIIGYGNRISHVAREMTKWGIPYAVVAVADPRCDQLASSGDAMLVDSRFYESADAMLAREELDGVMVGTRCNLHTEMALKVAARRLPLFLEKPVATSFAQLKALAQGFAGYEPTTVVSFPLRLTPIVPMTLEQAMAYIQDDELVEVTPQNIRLRKRELLPHLRKRAKQAADA
mgnify:CR=1 FL=1